MGGGVTDFFCSKKGGLPIASLDISGINDPAEIASRVEAKAEELYLDELRPVSKRAAAGSHYDKP
jgi:hypothetical protein